MKATNQERTRADGDAISRICDRYLPAGWAAKGWRRAWKRGRTHNGVPVEQVQ